MKITKALAFVTHVTGVCPCLGISFLHLQKGYLRNGMKIRLTSSEAKHIVFQNRAYSVSIGL